MEVEIDDIVFDGQFHATGLGLGFFLQVLVSGLGFRVSNLTGFSFRFRGQISHLTDVV